MSDTTKTDKPDLCANPQPPPPKAFQTTLTDMLNKMGANDKCKTIAKNSFDSGSSSSGTNFSEGGSSNSLNSSISIEKGKDTKKSYTTGFFTGKKDQSSVVETSSFDSSLSTSSENHQLNLTEAQAAAFNKGASEMYSEGCGNVLINAAKIANISQEMNCLIQRNMTSSTVKGSAGASITIAQTPFDFSTCMALAKTEAVQNYCIKSDEESRKSVTNLSGAKLTQKVTLDIKNKLELSESAKTEISKMQTEIANAVTESKLTSDNKLNGLPPAAKDITATDETISNSISTTKIDEKIKSVSISADANANITIKYSGDLNASGLEIDQNVMASVVTEVLVNDAISTGLTAASNITKTLQEKKVSMTSSEGQDMVALSATGSAGNAAVISASLQGVNAAAANNTSVDGAKLTNSLTELNKSNADLVKAQNEVTKDYIQNQGKGGAPGSASSVAGIIIGVILFFVFIGGGAVLFSYRKQIYEYLKKMTK